MSVLKAIFCCLVSSFLTVTAVLQYPFCHPSETPAPANKMPLFPAQYTAFARVDDLIDNITYYTQESFDSLNNMGRIVEIGQLVNTTTIYDYPADEVLIISDGQCTVEKLSTSRERFYFGYFNHATRNTSYALKFGSAYSEVFVGQEVIRGINLDHWSGCVLDNTQNQSYTTNHYLYASSNTDAYGQVSMPLKIMVNGAVKLTAAGPPAPIQLTYNYFSFEGGIDVGAFTPPKGVFCARGNQSKKMPKIAPQFYAHMEVFSRYPQVSEADIWWDRTNKVQRADVQAVKAAYTNIQDFNTGTSYLIDRSLGNCTIAGFNISYEAFGVNNKTTSAVHPIYDMRTSMAIFGLDSSFRYMGKRMYNDGIIWCDVYAGITTTLTGFDGLPVTVEAYFLQSNAKQYNTENTDNATQVPVRMDYTANGQLMASVLMSDFAAGPIDKSVFDVTSCFDRNQVSHFQLQMSRPTQPSYPDISTYQNALLTQVHKAMFTAANISFLRLQPLDLMWDDNSVYIKAALTERPPSISSFIQTRANTARVNCGTRVRGWGLENCAFQCLGNPAACVSFSYCTVIDQATQGAEGHPNRCFKNTCYDGPTATDGFKCSQWSRPFANAPKQEPVMTMAYENLKNAVYDDVLTVTMPMPNGESKSFRSIGVRDDILQTDVNTPQYSTNDIMKQFTIKRGIILIGHGEMHSRGLSADACAGYCNDVMSIRCQGFNYCYKTGDCYLTSMYMDDTSDATKFTRQGAHNMHCDIFTRNYMYRFTKSIGRTMVPTSDYIYTPTQTDSACARLCVQQSNMTCRSFEFCDQKKTCVLETSHRLGSPITGVPLSEPICYHYTRSYVVDFKATAKMQTSLKTGLQVLQKIKLDDCAKSCMDLQSGCLAFDYCGTDQICTLQGKGLTSTAQITLEAKPTCDHYTKLTNADGTPFKWVAQQQTLPDGTQQPVPGSSGYSAGSMAGLAIGMIIVTVAIVAGLMFAYKKQYFGAFIRSK